MLSSILILLTVCSNNTNNEIIKTIDSPDGKYVAYIFTRDLGATTKVSYQLSILEAGESLGDSGGNIFISYGSFDVEWSKQNLLYVKLKEKGDIFKNEKKYKDIVIEYS